MVHSSGIFGFDDPGGMIGFVAVVLSAPADGEILRGCKPSCGKYRAFQCVINYSPGLQDRPDGHRHRGTGHHLRHRRASCPRRRGSCCGLATF
jgi:hypothetical protein